MVAFLAQAPTFDASEVVAMLRLYTSTVDYILAEQKMFGAEHAGLEVLSTIVERRLFRFSNDIMKTNKQGFTNQMNCATKPNTIEHHVVTSLTSMASCCWQLARVGMCGMLVM